MSFDIPAQLSPLFLAFELQIGKHAELSRSGQRFAVPVGMSAGKIASMGESNIPSHSAALPFSSLIAAPCQHAKTVCLIHCTGSQEYHQTGLVYCHCAIGSEELARTGEGTP